MSINFISNEKNIEQLSFLLESGRLPHAIIIEGEEGLGKRALAKELALYLMCRSDGEKPCRQCPQCHKVLNGYHPDIYEFSATGAPSSFKVDEVRKIIEDSYVRPNEADYKVYILGNCQGMNLSAQNAILKLLEEPPSYVVFILTVSNKTALLDTVLSRSVVISLEGVDIQKGADYIVSQNEELDRADAVNALSAWHGNIGKALDSLEDGKLSKINDLACDMARALLSENEYELLKVCSAFDRDRPTLIAALEVLKVILRDAAVYSSNADIMSNQKELAKELCVNIGRARLIAMISKCDELKEYAERNGNNSLLITKVCYELRRSQGR